MTARSYAQAEQLRSVSVTRITDAAGWLSSGLMHELDDAIRVHLAL